MGMVPDDHEPTDDGIYFEMRIEFVAAPDTINGKVPLSVGGIETHVHHLDPQIAIDAMLHVAKEMVQSSMIEHMFRDEVPDEVKREASNVMALKYLVQRMESKEFNENGKIDFTVPDDASELFKGDEK